LTEASPRRPPRVLALVFGRFSDYVWALRPLFLLCLLLFVFSLAMGFYLGDKIPIEMLEDLLGTLPDVENMNLLTLFLFILGNNLFKSLLWMVSGFLFSVPSLLFTVLNGFFIGWLSHSVRVENGLLFTVVALVPHGIIEVPTVLLSSAAGMALGYQLVNRIRGRGSLRAEFGKALRLFIWRIAPLLLLAAIIEVTVTPLAIFLVS